MTKLFIQDNEVELTEDVQFAITREFEHLSNPAEICNEWSKEVKIPFTQKNNKLFGFINNPDKIVVDENKPTDFLNGVSGTNLNSGTWDAETRTLTSTRTNNTRGTSNYFKVNLYNGNTFVQQLGTSGASREGGVGYVTFIKDNTWNRFCVAFNGNNSDTSIFFQPTLTNGEKYTLTWRITILDRVTGNDAQVTQLVLTNTDYPYYWQEYQTEKLTGIYFNPYKKIPFRLEFDEAILMTGYVKFMETDNVGGFYKIRLYGELGRVFSEMQKVTFDKTTTETNYLINGSDYVDEYITRNLVAQSWNSSKQYDTALRKKNENGYKVTDIIGFAPNNAFSDAFDYETYEDLVNGVSCTFEETLGQGFQDLTGINAKAVIPNGMTSRGFGEYRSYLQLPYIYFNKLFKIYQAKCEEVTGYKWELDNSWFNISNPYWYRIVMMLKSFNTKKEDGATNYYNYTWSDTALYWDNNSSTEYKTAQTTVTPSTGETFPCLSASTYFVMNSKDYSLKCTVNPNITLRATNAKNWSGFEFARGQGICLDVEVQKENGNVIKTVRSFLATEGDETVVVPSGYTRYNVAFTHNVSNNIHTFTTPVNPQVTFTIPYGIANKFKIVMKAKFIAAGNRFRYKSGAIWDNTKLNTAMLSGTYTSLSVQKSTEIRSYSHFDLNDLWNNDYKPFDIILNYCKMYRIAIIADELNKKLKFIPYNKYFLNITVEDWTKKVDKSKEFSIKPVTFENKYILFNYDDNNTALGEKYKEKYGVNYGDYRLVTDYNFNSETKKLFEKVKTGIVYSENVLSWENLVNGEIVYSFPDEVYINNKDKSNKQVDVFGQMFYHRGRKSFSNEAKLRLPAVYLSDDTDMQNASEKYFFMKRRDSVMSFDPLYKVTGYPHLNVVYSTNMCLFNVPMENYTYLNNYSGKNTIYTNRWEKYLNERYNINNKVVTCYIYLKPEDYMNFDFNKFIRIDNQIYIVNKIVDYNVTSMKPTKVELITVQDINGYK